MWTYLAILGSGVVLLGIFVHRFVIFEKTSKFKEMPKEGVEEVADDDLPEKKRLSKDDREKLGQLYEDADSLLKKGKDDLAIKNFVQILAIDAHHLETLSALAILYLQKQMYGAAAALLKQLADQTGKAVHYSHLGLALFQQAEYEAARDAYQTAVDLDPARPQRFASLAQVYKALGQMNHAIMALNKAIELDRENQDLLFLLTDLQIELEDFVAAKKIIEEMLESDPKNKEAKDYLKRLAETGNQG